MYVIAGVSGNTGSVVATALLDAAQPVRVIVRDAAKGAPWAARGAEVAVAAFDDRAALARALAGASGAYLLLPPNEWTQTGIAENRKRLAAAIVGAIADARPGHVVQLSSLGAQHASGTGPIQYIHPIEAGIREAGVPATLLRAGMFVENWVALAPAAIASGTLYYGMHSDAPMAQIATPDIGAIAARTLLGGAPRGVRVLNLAGPVELTLQDTAAAIGRIGGVPINAVTVPLEAARAAMISNGASPAIAEMYAEMAGAYNAGLLAWEDHELVRGKIAVEDRLRALLKK